MKCRKLEFQFGNYSLLTFLLLVTCGESIFERALINNGLFDPPEVTNFTDTDISPFEEADISQFKSENENMQHIDNEPSTSETVLHEVDCGEKCSKDLERKENSSASSEHNEEPISIASKEIDVDTAKYGEQDSSILMKTIENCTSLSSTCTRDDIHGAEAISSTNATTSLTDDQQVQKLHTSSNLIENIDASTNEHKTNDKIEANKSFSDSTSTISHTNSKENEQSNSFSSFNATTQNLIDQMLSNHFEFERPSSTKTLRTNDFDDPLLVPYLQQIIHHLTRNPSHYLNTSRKDNINETIPSSSNGEKVVLYVGDSPTHSSHESKSDDRNNVHPTRGTNSTNLPSYTTTTITRLEAMAEEDAGKAIKQPSEGHNPTTVKPNHDNENVTGQEESLNSSTSIHRKSKHEQPTLPSIYTESAIEKLLGNNKPTISYHSTPGSTSTSNLFSTLDYLSTKTSFKSHRPEQHQSTHTPASPAQKHLTTYPPTQKHSPTHPPTQKNSPTRPPSQKHSTTHLLVQKHITTHPPTQKHVMTHSQTPKHVTTHQPTQKHVTTHPQTPKHLTTHHRTTHLHTVRIQKISQRPQSSYNVFDLSSDGHLTHRKLTEQSPYLQIQSKKPPKNYVATTTKHLNNIFRKPSKRRSHEPTYPTAFHPPFKKIFPQKTTPVHPRVAKVTNSVAYPPVSFDTSTQKNSLMTNNNNIKNNNNNNAEIGIPAAYAGCNGFEVTLCFGGEPYFNDSAITPTTEQYSKQQPVPVNTYAFPSNNDRANMEYTVHSDMTDPLNVTKKPVNYGNYVLPFSTPTKSQRAPMPKSVSSKNEARPPSIEGQPRTANPTVQTIQVTSSSINLEFPTVMLPPFHDASSSVLVQLPPVLLIPGSALPTQSAVSSRKAKTTPLATSVPLESHEIHSLTTSSAKKKTFPLSRVKPQLSLHASVESFHAIPTPSSNILIPMPLSPALAKNSRSSPIVHASAHNFRPPPNAHASAHNFRPPPNAHASVHNSRSPPNAHASVHNSRSPPNAQASIHNSRSPPNAHASVHNSHSPPNLHASVHNSRSSPNAHAFVHNARSSPNAHASAQIVPLNKSSTVKLQRGKTKEFCSNSNPSAACFDSITNSNKASLNPANNQPKVSNIKSVTVGLNAAHAGGKNPLFLHLPYPARPSKHVPVVRHPLPPKKNVTKAISESKPICSPKNPSASCVHFYASKEKGDIQKNLLSANKTGASWKSSVNTGKCVCRPSITKKPCACNCVKLGPFNVCKDPDVKDAFVYQHNS